MTASLALIAAAAFGTPTVTVVDPLHVRMSNREPLTFVAYLTEAKPADVSVTVPELKDPDTKPINPSGSLKVEPVADENGNARITLTPIGNEWNRFGDFAATVRIAVKDVATPLIKAATFSRVKPDLAVIDLAGKNFDMTRPYPWCSASRDVMVHLHNRSGAQVDRVTFAGHAIGEGGYVTVFPALKTVQPGVTPLRLWIHDITKAGTIPVKMSFTVPGAQTADEVSFNLLVSDNWPVPLLAIAAGVFLAFLVNLLANRLRPIQENRYRGLRLRQQVANLRLSTAEHKAEITSILSSLVDVDLLNDAGLATDAKTKLDGIEKSLGDLQKTIETERQVVDQLEAVRPQITQELQPLADDVQRLIDARKYGAAAAALTTLKAKLAAPQPERAARPEDADVPPTDSILIRTAERDRKAGKKISFHVDGAGPVIWDFDDDSGPEKGGTDVTHSFAEPGHYTVTATVEGERVIEQAVDIAPSPLQLRLRRAGVGLWANELVLSIIALIIAVATGMWLLYAGKQFGTAAEYCEAFLWGVGVDSSVRGFGAVMKKLTTNT